MQALRMQGALRGKRYAADVGSVGLERMTVGDFLLPAW
jgi:hypothetical protein